MFFFQIRFTATIVCVVVIQFVTRKEREKERILESIFTIRRIKKKMETTHTHKIAVSLNKFSLRTFYFVK